MKKFLPLLVLFPFFFHCQTRKTQSTSAASSSAYENIAIELVESSKTYVLKGCTPMPEEGTFENETCKAAKKFLEQNSKVLAELLKENELREKAIEQAKELGEDGEILVKGPNVMKGYYKNEEATKAAFNEEGWFQTGDLGKFNNEGFLTITGRKKDIIVMSNGKNVSPNPIENKLLSSPYIEQALLIGDEKPFITALIVPKFDVVKRHFQKRGVELKDNLSLVEDSRVKDLFNKEVRKLTSSSLAKFEQIKKVAVLAREFSMDLNEMTPTLKIKRNVVSQHFANEIAGLYAGQTELA